MVINHSRQHAARADVAASLSAFSVHQVLKSCPATPRAYVVLCVFLSKAGLTCPRQIVAYDRLLP
jgi:hypothetical protein